MARLLKRGCRSGLLIAVAAGWCFMPASAQAALLTGEQMAAGSVTEDRGLAQECDPSGISTVRFRAAGIAYGPYPGTFTETGTYTVGPQVVSDAPLSGFVSGSGKVGPVLSLSIDFEIISGTTRVTGTKRLDPAKVSYGACIRFTDTTIINPPLDRALLATATGAAYQLQSQSLYDAVITTQSEVMGDAGSSPVSFNEAYLTAATCLPAGNPCLPISGGSNGFGASFLSASSPECADLIDNDQNGKVDFPSDVGCASAADDSEAPAPAPPPACADGIDNDGDGKIDLDDPGCGSPSDGFEVDPPPMVPTDREQCMKGGFRNFPALGFKNQGDCVSYVVRR